MRGRAWLVSVAGALALGALAGAGLSQARGPALLRHGLAGIRAAFARTRPVAGRPDPRLPALRRVLALRPHERRAVWIALDRRAAASDLPPALSPAALARRARRGIAITPADRPINPALVERLRRAGARIRVEDRWTRSVSADVDSASAERLARMPEVRALEPVAKLQLAALPAGPAAELARAGARMRGVAAADSFYGISLSTLQQLNVPAAHAMGFTGRTVRIGLLDTGFDRNHQALQPLPVIARRDFIWGDTIVGDQPRDTAAAEDQAVHGTGTWSLLGGYKPGSFVGVAYGASFVLAKTEFNDPRPFDTHADEDRWIQGAQWEDSLGVDIISSSLSYRYGFPDGDYPCSAMNGRTLRIDSAASRLAHDGILLVNAIGNDAAAHADPNTGSASCTLNAPADADSIIAVGAVDAAGTVAYFSSRGPTADGRIKPELVAPGVSVFHARAGTSNGYVADSGTSFATPLIAGAAALVMEAWPNLSPYGVRQALIRSTPAGALISNATGAGVPDVAVAIMFPQGIGISGVSPLPDAQGQLASIAPTFNWVVPSVGTAIALVIYRVDMARDSLFQNIVFSDSVVNAFSLAVHTPIRPAPALWWRLVARAGAGVRRQVNAAGRLVMPHWVTLLNLNDHNGAFASDPRPVLRWSALAAPAPVGPLRFDVQVLDQQERVIAAETVSNLTADSVRVPQPLDFNAPYRWRVIARAGNVADTVTSLGTFVVNSDQSPPSTTLYQNFPNPFPRTDLGLLRTRVWFDLNASTTVELAVYDMRGRLVQRLIPAPGCPAQTLGPGTFGRIPLDNPCVLTSWDGTDENGHEMPRGIYLLRLRAGGVSQTRHIIYTP